MDRIDGGGTLSKFGVNDFGILMPVIHVHPHLEPVSLTQE